MWLILLAWKNLWRNKIRTAITMTAVYFAVILSVFASSLQVGIFENLIKNVVSFYTGYIQVYQKGYWDDQILDNVMVYDETLYKKMLKVINIADAAPRLEAFSLIATEKNTKGCMVVGMDPEKEDRVTALKSKLIQGEYLVANDPRVLLAEGLAKRINASLSDTIYLIGQGYHGTTAAGRYSVKGIVKFGSPAQNNQVIYLSFGKAQELYNAPGLATSAIISLENPSKLNTTLQALQNEVGNTHEVMSWEAILPEVKQHIETDTNSMKYIQAILYMLVSFGIFGTLLMMMVERKYELGMLVAIGMKKTKLCLLMMIESILTVFSGCMLGLLTSIPIVNYFHWNPLRIGGDAGSVFEKFGFEPIFPTSTRIDIFIQQGVTVLIIGLLLSIYPIYKILKIDPSSSMKR